MIITALGALDPRMVPGVQRYVRRCTEEGIPVIVLETRRELCTQMAYFSRGRGPKELVFAYFERCGLWKLTEVEAATINTKTLYSKHLDGLAIDAAPVKDGRPWWAAPREVWLRMFAIAEDECGLDACAAGKWESWNWDWPHHEFRVAI